MTTTDSPPDLGFTFEARANGDVIIFHRHRLAATLRGQAAKTFLAQGDSLSDAELQQVMARLTGNYKRGNERKAARHPRNRYP